MTMSTDVKKPARHVAVTRRVWATANEAVAGPTGLRRAATLASALALALGTAGALAAPPLQPLPLPYYSFDLASPTVMTGFVGAADMLTLGPAGPLVVVPGALLGLPSPFDDLDAISGPHNDWPAFAPFVLLFSVDRQSVGAVAPDPALVAAGVPYNVLDQAFRGHAAGDQFMSTSVFTLSGTASGMRTTNNAMVRNNYDEGGTDFGAVPPTSGSDVVPPGTPQDDVDGTQFGETVVRDGPLRVYFTASAESPSLPILSIGIPPSGATIFYNPAPLQFAPTERYAAFFQLGLQPNDDINALLVFDLNNNGIYDTPDRVLFSLAPGSPSLNTLPGHSPIGAAADIFIARPGQPTQIFAPAGVLGLGHPLDNINALEARLCPNGDGCAQLAGIRFRRGDTNCDHALTFDDIDAFVVALSGPDVYAAHYPNCFWHTADTNCDGTVNFDDIDAFVACLMGNCPCP